jgi:hypothetical protein
VRDSLREIVFSKRRSKKRQDALARERLIRENPTLLSLRLSRFSNFEKLLAEMIAKHLGVSVKTDSYPTLLSTMSVTIVRLSFRIWVETGVSPEKTFDKNFNKLENGL